MKNKRDFTNALEIPGRHVEIRHLLSGPCKFPQDNYIFSQYSWIFEAVLGW